MSNTKAPKFGPVHATPAYTITIRGEHGASIYGNPEHVDGQIECYLSSRPAGVVDVTYSEHCAKCSGSGRVRANRRMLSWRPCPACGGSPDLFAGVVVRTVSAAAA